MSLLGRRLPNLARTWWTSPASKSLPAKWSVRSVATSVGSWSPRVQHPAPDFKAQAVVDGQFKEICLSDYKGKYLVLYFYPLDFTFVCPTEIIAFSDR